MCETPEFGKNNVSVLRKTIYKPQQIPVLQPRYSFPGKDVRFGNAYTNPHLSLSVRIRCHTGEYRALYQRVCGFLNPKSPRMESSSCQEEQLYVSHLTRPQYNTKIYTILRHKI